MVLKLCKPHAISITRSSKWALVLRKTSCTIRQRFTAAMTCSTRIRIRAIIVFSALSSGLSSWVAPQLTVVLAPPLDETCERMCRTPTLRGWRPTRWWHVIRQQFSHTPAMIRDPGGHRRGGLGPTEGKLRCDPVWPHRTGKVRMATSYSSATSAKVSSRYTARLCSVACPLSSCSFGLMIPCFVRYVMN